MTVAAVVLLTVAVATAQAAVRAGTYKGKTDKGTPITFKVTKKGKAKRISHFAFHASKAKPVMMKCSDGDRFPIEDKFTSGKKKLPIRRTGKFSVSVTYADGGKWTATGRISGKRSRAKGTLRLRVRFDTNNQPSPTGSVRCDSGKRKFAARRR